MKGHNNTLKYILENGILSKATIEENIEMDDALYLLEKLRNPTSNNTNKLTSLAIELAMHTGMRVGELVALEWDDILENDGIIIIRHSEKFDRLTKEYRIESTKNSRVRFFPIS